jgi:hypothetical protein
MKLRSVIQRLFSGRISRPKFEDYPIDTWKNPDATDHGFTWGARIFNWSLMLGYGATEEQAIAELKKMFTLYERNNQELPDPGAKVPVQFASATQIGKFEKIAVDFFKMILDMDYRQGFYSDGTGLANFESLDKAVAKQQRAEVVKRTRSVYGVDITSTYDGPLYLVFEQIKTRGTNRDR